MYSSTLFIANCESHVFFFCLFKKKKIKNCEKAFVYLYLPFTIRITKQTVHALSTRPFLPPCPAFNSGWIYLFCTQFVLFKWHFVLCCSFSMLRRCFNCELYVRVYCVVGTSGANSRSHSHPHPHPHPCTRPRPRSHSKR